MAVAQAALTLADMTGGRFLPGLGPSGPQVIEGLHGVPFARPLTRLRETVDVVRRVFAGEKVAGTTLIGTEDMVRARLRVWRDAGVDTVRLYPAGDSLDDRLTTLESNTSLHERHSRPTGSDESAVRPVPSQGLAGSTGPFSRDWARSIPRGNL